MSYRPDTADGAGAWVAFLLLAAALFVSVLEFQFGFFRFVSIYLGSPLTR